MSYAQTQGQAGLEDVAAMFQLYIDNIDTLRKNYETIAQVARETVSAGAQGFNHQPLDQTMANAERTGAEMFRRFVEQQIELCRFYGKRWEHYLNLPDQISHCRTPAELAQFQMHFLNAMAADYALETVKLTQPMTEAIAGWTAGRVFH